MLRRIDPQVARRTAARMEAVERDLSMQVSVAIALLQTAGGSAQGASRIRASSNWWTQEAAHLRMRADAVEAEVGQARLAGPTISPPPSPYDTLLTEIDQLEQRRATLVAHLGLLDLFVSWLPGDPLRRLRSEMTRAVATLDRAVADRKAWAGPARNVLLYDPTGDGRIAESIGDLQSARHLAVLVPGVGTDLESYERTLYADARRLSERLTGTDTVVVTWLGYDPPDTVVAALAQEPAAEGARALGDFVADLPPAHTTVIGHSYGSLVAGIAARDGLITPDELVFIGSPGVGATNVQGLNVPAETTVWSALSPLDPIRLARPDCWIPPSRCSTDMVFGTDPHSPVFGSRTFATGDAPPWSAHSAYYREGSPSLENLAHIVLGEDDAVSGGG